MLKLPAFSRRVKVVKAAEEGSD